MDDSGDCGDDDDYDDDCDDDDDDDNYADTDDHEENAADDDDLTKMLLIPPNASLPSQHKLKPSRCKRTSTK